MWEPEHSVILPLRSVVHRSNVTLAVSVGTPRFALLCGAVQRHWRPWSGFRPPCAIRVSGATGMDLASPQACRMDGKTM